MRRGTLSGASLEAAALHYLERFSSSAENLRRVLMRRVRRAAAAGEEVGEAPALIDALVARLVASGMLDDRRFAEAKAWSLLRRGASRRAIAARLTGQGVERALVAAAIGEASRGSDPDLAAACALARRRRLGPYRPAAERAAMRRKDLAVFARAGFSQHIARQVLSCADRDAAERLARGE